MRGFACHLEHHSTGLIEFYITLQTTYSVNLYNLYKSQPDQHYDYDFTKLIQNQS